MTAALDIINVTACSGGITESESTAKDSASGSKGESISILMGKSEVGSQFEKMLADYSGKNNLNVIVIPLAGQDAYK